MALSLRERAALTDDIDFQRAVKMSMVKAAVAISTEQAGRRTDLAYQVLREPERHIWNFVLAVASRTENAGPTDEDINGHVSSIWTAMAGK